MTDTKRIPDEEELVQYIHQLKLDHPEWGIKSIHSHIANEQQDWQVSDKRVKKLMQSKGLTAAEPAKPDPRDNVVKSGVSDDPSVPVSFINPSLKFEQDTPKVEAKMIDNVTGKGLFAATDIKKDEIIFTETPLVYFPPWEGFNLARTGNACGLCCKPFMHSVRLGSRCSHCDILYCSKQCRTIAWETFHQLECTGLNPAIMDFMNMCSNENWQAPMVVSRIYAHLILAHQRDELDQTLLNYDAFATVNQAERQAKETEWIFMEHPTRELWKKARTLLAKAYKSPPKKCKITKPLPPALAKSLFDDEDTFLNYLGKFNINNQNGGLYLIHSHINHNCTPNVSIDYSSVHRSQYKLMVRAIRAIPKGEQLCESYVNPRWNKETRQNYLSKSYLFDCQCQRCETDGPLTDELRQGLRLRSE
ncbi:SET domain-containing protein [Hesseltinella vesiculosa]|uniref:Histone-lysine N-methyltransferase SET5 n=1 Tax=Hesseltinella vesiculosa TaxID=101127 RepID=A0A1X2GW78_9FUNG|nr:SET domain-containing protein [Hesseltinella vesiculosa]